jgi:nicotinate dehydrogenase subunit B
MGRVQLHRQAGSPIKDSRGVKLLTRLARFVAWEKRTATGRKPNHGDGASGRGVAYVRYELARTYVGAVADVEVHRDRGGIRVTHFFVVQDCGQVINPDAVRAQLGGNITQTVSRAFKERVSFDRSRVTSVDWASYPILTFPEVPEIHGSHRPASKETMERWRTVSRRRVGGDLERGL